MFTNKLRSTSSDESALVPIYNPFEASVKMFEDAVYIRRLHPLELVSPDIRTFIDECIYSTSNTSEIFGIFDHDGSLLAAAISRSQAIEGALNEKFKPQAWLH